MNNGLTTAQKPGPMDNKGIYIEINLLEEVAKGLENLTTELLARLSDFIENRPEPCSPPSEQQPTSCNFAAHLRDLSNNLNFSLDRVRDILDRLEL